MEEYKPSKRRRIWLSPISLDVITRWIGVGIFFGQVLGNNFAQIF